VCITAALGILLAANHAARLVHHQDYVVPGLLHPLAIDLYMVLFGVHGRTRFRHTAVYDYATHGDPFVGLTAGQSSGFGKKTL
jgi:hypothetical protein